MIFADDTEARKTTRLPKSVRDGARVLTGLEDATGADLLLYDGDVSLDAVDDTPLAQARLRKMCQDGILIQRKTERDVCNSIPRLKEHLAKMQLWCPFCWLAVEGHITRALDGKTSVLKREKHYQSGKVFVLYEKTGWDYGAYLAAIVKWQLRGGLYLPVPNADAWPSALVTVTRVTQHLRKEPEKVIIGHEKVQTLRIEDRQIATVASLPGLGGKRAPMVWAQYHNLANLIVALSDPYQETDGVGTKGQHNIRQYLGLESTEKLAKVAVDEAKKPLGDEPNF